MSERTQSTPSVVDRVRERLSARQELAEAEGKLREAEQEVERRRAAKVAAERKLQATDPQNRRFDKPNVRNA